MTGEKGTVKRLRAHKKIKDGKAIAEEDK